MQKINFEKKLYTTCSTEVRKDRDTEHFELGKELTRHFKVKCFWLPYRYPMWRIREAFKVCQTQDKGFQYLLGILNKQ